MMAELDCGEVVNGRGNLAPLECKTLIDPLQRDFLLTDVVFELYDHPNGDQSRACGFVWNVLSGQWSRLLLGGHVDDRSRQYHFQTGLVCLRGSFLSVCTCFFVNQSTSRLWAVLSGYYCEDAGREIEDLDMRAVSTIDWTDLQPPEVIDPIDPTGRGEVTQDIEGSLRARTLLGTTRDMVEPGDLLIEGAEGRSIVPAGATVAVRVAGHEVAWTLGERQGPTRCPEGANLVVVRRSLDGRSIHWICYREE
jgi:hypothetical protein